MTTTLPFFPEISAACSEVSIDPLVLYAIMQHESGGNTWAMRYEAAYHYLVQPRDFASSLGISYDTELVCQKSSWGLCQVMGGVAREHGYMGHLTELCRPDLGIKYAAAHLKKKFTKYGEETAAIAAYNQGNARKWGTAYANEVTYVDPVLLKLRALRALA